MSVAGKQRWTTSLSVPIRTFASGLHAPHTPQEAPRSAIIRHLIRSRRSLSPIHHHFLPPPLRTYVLNTQAIRNLHTSLRRSAETRFSYHVSASYVAKAHRLNPDRNLYNFNPFVRLKKTATELQSGKQDRQKRPHSGEDAFFISNVGDSGTVAFGVADGVGGWNTSGIDPADFSHSLCDYMASASSGYPEGFTAGPMRASELLQRGYNSVMNDKSIIGGGSTACIATAEADGHVEVANLGDSGFIHLGLNSVRHHSPPQTHAFNTPFQLSKIPARMAAQMAIFGQGRPLSEHPSAADISSHQVKHGDVLVFATDGVWDNLSPQDALTIVSRYMTDLGAWTQAPDGQEMRVGKHFAALTKDGSGNATLQATLAVAIARSAKEASLNAKRDGPFAREVQKRLPSENWHGGKPDDICTIVAIAVEEMV